MRRHLFMFSLDTLFELSTPPPSSAELSYRGMLWTGYFDWTASFIIRIQLSSDSISRWIPVLCDQRPVHSWGRYCFKAAGNDLSSEGGDEDNGWVLWVVSESLGTSNTLNTFFGFNCDIWRTGFGNSNQTTELVQSYFVNTNQKTNCQSEFNIISMNYHFNWNYCACTQHLASSVSSLPDLIKLAVDKKCKPSPRVVARQMIAGKKQCCPMFPTWFTNSALCFLSTRLPSKQAKRLHYRKWTQYHVTVSIW